MAIRYTAYDHEHVEASELFEESIIEVGLGMDGCRFMVTGQDMVMYTVFFTEMTTELWQVFNERYKDKTGTAFCIHPSKVL